MYMKKSMIIGFISIIFASVLLSSCDLLDLTPKAAVTVKTYFKNESELELYANRFYSDILPGGSGIYKEIGDNMIWIPLASEVSLTRTVPEKGGGWSFEALRHINFLLENISNCSDAAAVRKYTGVAKFFRAHYYFNMVKRFGDVPWLDHVPGTDDPALYKARDSRDFVMEKVIEDIDEAIRLFKKENSTKDLYHVTWWTAMALKSRICLFEGTFRKYHGLEDYEKYLNACVSASETFMNESGYTLYKSGSTPYRDLFASINLQADEVIFGRDYEASLSVLHNVQNYENSTTMGRPGMNKKIVNSYLMADGSRFTDKAGYETMTFDQECQNRDPRLAQTIRTPGYTRIGSTKKEAPNLAYTMTGYHLIKYSMTANYDEYNKSCNDIPLFRTAEVYLNFAEAKAELGTLKQADINKSIKLLRDRVGMTNLDMELANSKPDPYLISAATGYPNVKGANQGVILEIRRERTIELAMEGFRYYDIMRWKEGKLFENDLLGIYVPGPGTYDLDKDGTDDVCFYVGTKPAGNVPLYLEIGEQIRLSNGESGYIICHSLITKKWNEDRDYLYPVPISERTLSNGVITQNPGWNDGLNFN